MAGHADSPGRRAAQRWWPRTLGDEIRLGASKAIARLRALPSDAPLRRHDLEATGSRVLELAFLHVVGRGAEEGATVETSDLQSVITQHADWLPTILDRVVLGPRPNDAAWIEALTEEAA